MVCSGSGKFGAKALQRTCQVAKSPAGTKLTRASTTSQSQRRRTSLAWPVSAQVVRRVSPKLTRLPAASGHRAEGSPSIVLSTR